MQCNSTRFFSVLVENLNLPFLVSMPSLVWPWLCQEVESRRSRQMLHKTKQEDLPQQALVVMRKRMNILVDCASSRQRLSLNTWLICDVEHTQRYQIYQRFIAIVMWECWCNLAASGYSTGEKAWLYLSSQNISGFHFLPGGSFLRALPSADWVNLRGMFTKSAV